MALAEGGESGWSHVRSKVLRQHPQEYRTTLAESNIKRLAM